MATRELNVVLVVPDTNTTMEAELPALWPDIAEIHRVGVPRPMRPLVAADIPEYRDNTLKAVAELGKVEADVVLYGCTTAGYLGGARSDAELQKALSDMLGAPTITTASSMVDILRANGVARPAIITPYLETSNQKLKDFLAANGIAVAVLNSFLFTTTEQYDTVTAEAVYELAAATGTEPGADGLFIPCTQLPTLGILEKLRHRLGKPVFGAIESMVWNARRMLATTP